MAEIADPRSPCSPAGAGREGQRRRGLQGAVDHHPDRAALGGDQHPAAGAKEIDVGEATLPTRASVKPVSLGKAAPADGTGKTMSVDAKTVRQRRRRIERLCATQAGRLLRNVENQR